jgi:hypothetical protein
MKAKSEVSVPPDFAETVELCFATGPPRMQKNLKVHENTSEYLFVRHPVRFLLCLFCFYFRKRKTGLGLPRVRFGRPSSHGNNSFTNPLYVSHT